MLDSLIFIFRFKNLLVSHYNYIFRLSHRHCVIRRKYAQSLSFLTTIFIALIAILFISIGLSGYLIMPLGWLERALFLIAGLIMVSPDSKVVFVGLVLGLVMLFIISIKARAANKKLSGTI